MSTLVLVTTNGIALAVGAAVMYLPAVRKLADARLIEAHADRTFTAAESLADEVERTRNLPWHYAIEAGELEEKPEPWIADESLWAAAALRPVDGEVLHVEHPTGEHPALSRIDELIAASSLGTPDAVQLRESVDDEVARRIVERSKEFGGWLADANAAAEEHVAERLDVSAELAKLKQRAAEAERACCEGHGDEPCDPHAGYVLPCCGDCPDWPHFIALDDQPEHDDEDAPADDTYRPGLHLVLLAIPVALWDRLREWWRSLWAARRERHMVGSGEQATADDPFAELLAHVEANDVEERRVEIEAWVQANPPTPPSYKPWHLNDVTALHEVVRPGRHRAAEIPAQRDGGDDL